MWLLLVVLLVQLNLSAGRPCEQKDAFGYNDIPNDVDYGDWAVAAGAALYDGTIAIPHGQGNTTEDCYMLHSPGASTNENTLLFSPCYTVDDTVNESPSLRFYHFTYGTLRVHVTNSCRTTNEWTYSDISSSNAIWEFVGDQPDAWTEVELTLDVISTDSFQILFEAFTGDGSAGYIAIDSLDISGVTCYLDHTFFCDNSNCIPGAWTCDEDEIDGGIDCIDGSDEAEATCSVCNSDTEFRCNNGRCIDIERVCDGVNHCTNDGEGEDETDCQGITTVPNTITMTESPTTARTTKQATFTMTTSQKEMTLKSGPDIGKEETSPTTGQNSESTVTSPIYANKVSTTFAEEAVNPVQIVFRNNPGVVAGTFIGGVIASSIIWLLVILFMMKTWNKRDTTANTRPQTEIGQDGYAAYNGNVQEPYAELNTKSPEVNQREPSATKPAVGEDGYTQYKGNGADNQKPYEELKKSVPPDSNGTVDSDTKYEVTSLEANIDENHETLKYENLSSDDLEGKDDDDYAYAYSNVVKQKTMTNI